MEIAPKKKVLIVEDDRALRQALVEKFTSEDFAVLSSQNGIDGLANALTNRPDIILLDIIMPDVDGLTMLERLRQANSWGKGVQVILLTNVTPDSEEVITRITQNPPSFYMVKSDYMLSEVVAKVRECLALIDARAAVV
jgi:DNA-binding response OmpR family regulator